MNWLKCFKANDDKNETAEDDDNINKESTKSIPYYKLYRFSTSLDIFLIFVGVVASIICGILQPYLMILFSDISGIIVEYVSKIDTNLTNVESDAARQDLTNETIYFAVLSSIAASVIIFCTYISSVCFTWSSLRQTYKMKQYFFEKVLYQDIGWYDQTSTGDFATVITENIPKIEDGIGEKVGIVFFLLTTFFTGMIWALIKGWKLSLICMISFPLQLLIMTIITKLSAKYSKQEMIAYSAAGSIAEEVLSSIGTVVSFNAQEKEAKRYEVHVKNAQYNNITKCFFNALNQGFIFFLAYAAYALAFWYGVGLVLEERTLPENQIVYTPGNMMGVFFLTLLATWNFSSASPYVEVFGMACGAAFKVFEILNSQSVINKQNNHGKKPPFVADMVFKNVSFSYPSRNTVPILKNINIEISFGQTVAFVGHSGSGKSTMVQLLQRFYDPTSGTITVDGVDLRDINLSYLRFSVGVVNQEPALFATTIAENIRYGKLNASFDDIVDAAKKANAHKFICDLPCGYQTIVGEKGAQLSGGQKQRIAIARALIKEPNLMILDEATSALDTASEIEVQEALDTIKDECTRIVVAHRLSTIRNADRILVFDKGQIVEEGSHDQLMESKGAYYNMINLQGFTELNTDVENKEDLNQSDKSSNLNINETKKDFTNDTEEENSEKINTSKVLFNIIKTNSSEWFAILLGCLASVLNGASLPLYGLVFGDIVAVLSFPDSEYVRSETNHFCLYFLYLALGTALAMFLQIYCFGYTSEKLIYKLRNKMFSSMLKQEMAWFDRKENGVGALCAQLSGDAASVQGIDGSRVGLILNSLSTLILSLVFSLYLDWRLALVAGVFLPVLIFSIYYERKSVQQEAFYTQKLIKQSAKIAVESIDNIRTVKSLGCERVFYETYLEELKQCKSIGIKKSHMKAIMIGGARGLQFFAYAVGIRYGVYLLIANKIDLDTLFKVLEVMITGSWSIGNALSFSTNIQKGLSAASRIFAFFDREPRIKNQLLAKIQVWDNCDVNFSNINFAYPSRPSTPVLNNFNLSILQGKNIALVGNSGSGKSTVIKLLLRFYDPISGNVVINDDDVRIMNLNSLRSQLGIVSQEPNLFDLTVADNISYGVQHKVPTIEDIHDAARAANIHNFIISLPLGYKTRIGSKGKQLSGGQKQRIAIARALMMNPKILLLDEATSALDNESEKVVQEALDNARKGKTCITIAHRLTTIQDADLICVVKDGQVVEMGPHNLLLSKKGDYYDYYKLQSGQN